MQQSKRSFSKSRLEEPILLVEELEVGEVGDSLLLEELEDEDDGDKLSRAVDILGCLILGTAMLEELLADDVRRDCLFVSPTLFMIWNKNELKMLKKFAIRICK